MSRWLGSAVLAIVLPVGCSDEIAPADRVAELEGEPVLYSSFEAFLEQNAIEHTGVLGSDVLSALLDQFLDEQLLLRLAAEELGLSDLDDGRAAADALLAERPFEPSANEVMAYYLRYQEDYDLPERIYLRQLLFTDRGKAEQVRAQWTAGMPYAQLLTSLADEPAAHIGEEGEFSRDSLPPALADTLFSLTAGEISEVLTADYGFHVFQVVEVLPAGLAPLEEVAAEIRAELTRLRRQETLDRLVEQARERYNVRVFGRNVPFNYHGRFETETDPANH